MLNKKIKILSFIGVVILGFQPALLAKTTTTYAETLISDIETTSETKELDAPELFNDVKENSSEHLTEETKITEGTEISTLTDENDEVKATEMTDIKTNETIVITNTGSEIIIETTTINNEGEQETIQEIFPVITADTQDNLLNNKLVYSGWSYTGLAVGKNVFAVVAGAAISKITAAFAAIFGISGTAASFAVNYMGIRSGMTAANLAKYLDSNGNGWIALYKRSLRYYNGGNIIGYQHRTY